VFYLVSSLAVLGLYAWADTTGWELVAAHRQFIPAGVRQSPGGYRSFHFWHTGWHGGK
jgi:hypothetical protein